MFKNSLSILVCALIIFSCSNSDNNTSVIPPIEENLIGLKNYGEETGSYDESIDIFKTANGYIAFENKNKFDINITYEGNADILIRKLDDNLETVNEFVFETNEYEVLSSVAKIDDEKFAITGQFEAEAGGFANNYFFLDIISDTGEVLSSKVLNQIPVSGGFSQIVYKNGVLYVTAALNGNDSVSIVALDMNLNELWRKDYGFFGQGSIYVDDYIYFGLVDLSGTAQEPTDTSLHYLDIATGTTIKTVTYDDVDSPTYRIEKIIPAGQSLYLVGGAVHLNDGYIVEVNKEDGQIVRDIYVDNFLWLNDLIISGDDFVVSGTYSNVGTAKINSDGNLIWMNLLPISGASQVYKIIDNLNGTITFCGEAKITEEDWSTDAIYGITNIETGKLE